MMKPPPLRLVPEGASPDTSESAPLNRAAILSQMRQIIRWQADVTLGFDQAGQPFVRSYYGGFLGREDVQELRLFLDLYAQVCPDDRTVAHSNGQRCEVPDCEHCLNQELEMRLRTYRSHVCVLKRSVQPGEVALVRIGDIYKVVASRDMSTRLRGIERATGSTTRCLHRVRTNDLNALKYLWLNAFAFFLCDGHEDFALPERAVERFKAQGPTEIQRKPNGGLDVPQHFQAQSFGVSLSEYPALRGQH